MKYYDVIVLGAGAAGLFCAIEAARRGRSVLLVDHSKAIGEKIRISGGGRCNFTNLNILSDRFLSQNPYFARSALARYTQWDFIDRIASNGIAYHEKTLGQLFCDGSAKEIIAMLGNDLRNAGVDLLLNTDVASIERDEMYKISTSKGIFSTESCVIATGGKSIPKMGATGFGYQIAEQFDVPIVPTRAGLVPLSFNGPLLESMKPLAGVSTDATVATGNTEFREGLLFTHRGLSGPSILQASSYWVEGTQLKVNLAPEVNVLDVLKAQRQKVGRIGLVRALSEILPKSLAQFCVNSSGLQGNLADQSDAKLTLLSQHVTQWSVLPSGTEGYRTAEVTLGGIDTDALDPKTMECRSVPGLYFIGEVVDVTGWLGGYNFQWAWSSGWVAGQAV